MIEYIITSLVFLLVFLSLIIALEHRLLANIILLNIFSMLMSLMYLILNAPDVSMTEAAVSACVSTIFMLCALSSMKQEDRQATASSANLFSLLCVVIIIGIFIYVIEDMTSFGDSSTALHAHVSDYYLRNTFDLMEISNVVSAVLANFRAYDTLGETVVIFSAGFAVFAILRLGKEKKE